MIHNGKRMDKMEDEKDEMEDEKSDRRESD
jgi:hypothetical protein